MTELLQSRDKTLTNEELLLMAKQRKSFLETKPTHGKDAVNFELNNNKRFRILHTSICNI